MALPLPIELQTITRLLAAVAVLFYLWPRYALQDYPAVSRTDMALGNAAQMLVVLILAGYTLAAAQIFNWLTLALAVALLRLARSVEHGTAYDLRPGSMLAARVLEELDRVGGWPERLLTHFRHGRTTKVPRRRLAPVALLALLALAIVFAVATWMRLAVPFAHAAMPYSDAPVTLGWSQAVQQQQLFPEGIYPEGYYVLIADLIRFAAANPVVGIKFFGPLVGVLLVASVGFSTYRLTGRLPAALVAMAAYGTVPYLLPYDYLRQVGPDAQEFGNALVLPTLWFVYASWVRPEAFWRIAGLALLTAVALIHPVAALNAGWAAVAATVAAWVTHGVPRAGLAWYRHWLPRALLLASLPLTIGMALGIPLNTSGVQFLVSSASQGASQLPLLAKIALLSPLALLAVRLAGRLGHRQDAGDPGLPIAALLTLLGALAIQAAPSLGLRSAVLLDRAGEFVALGEVVCLGMGVAAVQELLALLHARTSEWVTLLGASSLVAYAWLLFPPVPFNALQNYRWIPDDFVAASVRIATSFPHNSWLIVADNDGFDYSYGQGFSMNGTDLLAHVVATTRWPVYSTAGQSSYQLPEDHIFFFVDKRIVASPAYRGLAVPERRTQQRAIRAWLSTWEAHHGQLPVYFQGPDLTVYELAQHTGDTQAALGETRP